MTSEKADRHRNRVTQAKGVSFLRLSPAGETAFGRLYRRRLSRDGD